MRYKKLLLTTGWKLLIVGFISILVYVLPQRILANDHSTQNTKNWLSIGLEKIDTKNENDVLKQKLHILLRQHAVVGGIAFIKRYDQNPDYERLEDEIKNNTEKLSGVIGAMYGTEKEDEFKKLWEKHINLLGEYTDATRTKNEMKSQATINNLQIVADELTQFFANNGTLSKEELSKMIKTHIDQEKGIIDNTGTHNDREILSLLIESGNHADIMADMLLRNK